jgi:SEC-C motif-containing protein
VPLEDAVPLEEAVPSDACPCGSGRSYPDCCAPLHRGDAAAVTAEQLMRSRYAAFAVGDAAYLLATWHPRTRPARIDLDPAQVWTRLRILGAVRGGSADTDGEVTFRAHYRVGGEPATLREHSRFVRVDGRWLYLDGQT